MVTTPYFTLADIEKACWAAGIIIDFELYKGLSGDLRFRFRPRYDLEEDPHELSAQYGDPDTPSPTDHRRPQTVPAGRFASKSMEEDAAAALAKAGAARAKAGLPEQVA